MKTHRFLVSSNGWEYSSLVEIKADKIEVVWECDDWDKENYLSNNRNHGEHNEGNAIIADGVLIVFNEPLESIK